MIKKLWDISTISKIILKNQTSIKDGSGIINEFETNFKNFIGRKFSIATNNGTSALHSAYFALSLEKGDEVILPSYTWHATGLPALLLGAKPVFAEIEPKTLTMNPKSVERLITKNTKAIVAVHLWGNICDLDGLLSLKEKYNLKLVEDCSHAFGAEYNGKTIGSFGNVSCFSMQKTKAVKAGEGGVLVTDDREIYERALAFGQHGRLEKELTLPSLKKYSYTGLGYKYRPHPLAIALANNSLQTLDARTSKQLKKIDRLNHIFESMEQITIPWVDSKVKRGFIHQYRVLFNGDLHEKTQFIEQLNKKGIKAKEENYRLLHEQPMFNTKVQLPVTEKTHKRLIAISLR